MCVCVCVCVHHALHSCMQGILARSAFGHAGGRGSRHCRAALLEQRSRQAAFHDKLAFQFHYCRVTKSTVRWAGLYTFHAKLAWLAEFHQSDTKPIISMVPQL